MINFIYNDMAFSIVKTGCGWDISRKLSNGDVAMVATGLFADVTDAEARAQALVRAIFPVGIKIFGPDVSHPSWVGDLKIVGPDVSHPNFIYWDKDSSSFIR